MATHALGLLSSNARLFGNPVFSETSSTVTLYSQRKARLFGLLLACLLGGIVVAISFSRSKQPAVVPEYSNMLAAASRFDGEFPCVFASVTDGEIVPQVGNCAMPTMHGAPTDRFEADLRYGNFALRETDLFLDDGFKVPLARSYCSNEWVDRNPVHAFGRNSNHPFDIAPIGTRNPYTYQMIVLEDADFLYFDRISKGTGYADAVFQHTETSTRFYKATTRWDGHGWTTTLADGLEILFPESYDAKNLAQGAPYQMRDASGNRLELERDPQRNLQEIRTPHGHWIKFIYDDLSRIKHAEDDAGHWAQHAFNADGMLESAILSSGHQRHYDYNRVLMTKITDEKGHVLIRNWFVGRRLLRSNSSGTAGSVRTVTTGLKMNTFREESESRCRMEHCGNYQLQIPSRNT